MLSSIRYSNCETKVLNLYKVLYVLVLSDVSLMVNRSYKIKRPRGPYSVHLIPFVDDQSETKAPVFVFRIGRKTTNFVMLVEGVLYLLHVKFRPIPVQRLQSWSEMSQPVRGRAAIFVFWLVKNGLRTCEFFLHVKICQIPFSVCRVQVENVSAINRQSLFSDRYRRRWVLTSCQVSSNSVQRRSENVSANNRPGSHLCFLIGPKKLGGGRAVLASWQVSSHFR